MNYRKKIWSVSPGNIGLFFDLGIMYLKINEVDRAYEKLQEANEKICMNRKEKNPFILKQLNFLFPFSISQKASEPNSNSLLPQIYYSLGAILQTKNESEAALNMYKNIKNIQEEGFELWNNIGMCFYRKNKLIAVICQWLNKPHYK